MVCLLQLSLKEPAFNFVDFVYGLLYFFFIYFCPNFYDLRFFMSSLSICFRCRVRLFICLFSCFLRQAWIAMILPLSTAFSESHKFWIVMFSFSFFSMHILISFLISSVICWLFRSLLFSLHMSVLSIAFFLQLTSNLPDCDQKRYLELYQFF